MNKPMSKNIDDVIEEVLPDDAFNDPAEDCQLRKDRDSLKQAILDKKMVVPLSEETIVKCLEKLAFNQMNAIHKAVDKKGLMGTDWDDIDAEGGFLDFNVMAKAIYESQFKRGEK